MSKEPYEEYIGLSAVEYFDLYSKVKGAVGDRDVAMLILKEMARDIRFNKVRQEQRKKDSAPATERQKAHMKRLDIEFGPEITFGEARQLIDSELERWD